jgi:hypothetical protein
MLRDLGRRRVKKKERGAQFPEVSRSSGVSESSVDVDSKSTKEEAYPIFELTGFDLEVGSCLGVRKPLNY